VPAARRGRAVSASFPDPLMISAAGGVLNRESPLTCDDRVLEAVIGSDLDGISGVRLLPASSRVDVSFDKPNLVSAGLVPVLRRAAEAGLGRLIADRLRGTVALSPHT
jgi:hypothetical protein